MQKKGRKMIRFFTPEYVDLKGVIDILNYIQNLNKGIEKII